jgi:hypothetical protein
MTYKRPQNESELVQFVRSIDVRAPESLHSEVQAMIARHGGGRSSGRATGVLARGLAPRFAAGLAVVAAAAIAIALSVGGSGSSGSTLRATAALTLLPATAGAPSKNAAGHAELTAAVDGVSFPYWEDSLGWRSTGTRSDRVAGRLVTTVFYADGNGENVGYAIVSGRRAPAVTGGATTVRGGVRYRVFSENGRPVVMWLRRGHMCVLSGRGVSARTLLTLASWHAPAVA